MLTDPAETGAVTLALPEDVQTEAFDCPDAFLERAGVDVWRATGRDRRDRARGRADRTAKRPLIVAGGGAIYAEALRALRTFADATGIPVARRRRARARCSPTIRWRSAPMGATGTAGGQRAGRARRTS